MTKKQAADFLDIGERSLDRYMARGEIKFSYKKGRYGQEVVFEQEEVERFKDTINAPVTAIAIPESQAIQSPPQPLPPVTPPQPATPLSPTDRLALVQIAALKITLRIEEAQRLTGYSRPFIREAIASGALKAHQAGGAWCIKRADLDAWIKKL